MWNDSMDHQVRFFIVHKMTLITNKEPEDTICCITFNSFLAPMCLALFSIVGGHDLSHLAARLYYSTNSILTTETIIRAEAVSGRNI